MSSPEHILALFETRGALAYAGENVTQLQHAWQCGRLAQSAGASPALQLAAWLHDVGHLVSSDPGTPTLAGHDDRHEVVAAALSAPVFGEAVAQPIALHVQAKRYLITQRPAYLARLSEDSLRSLTLQGGRMSVQEQQAFQAQRHAQDALQLRTWDDIGKDPDWWYPSTSQALRALHVLMVQVLNARHQTVATPS